ncbi:substrate-binding domain-containing protein [Streptomyces sp. KL116D]|uniref:substrate-binding domain-containing protein n=1 Tax=Streptomyces sp. KL116D TaxID=3045152 RepID=UPI003557647D
MTQAEGAGGRRPARPGRGAPGALLFANDRWRSERCTPWNGGRTRVPEDVAVTGFDGIALSRLVRPALTTVRQPMRRMGEEAVELLVRRLTGLTGATRCR